MPPDRVLRRRQSIRLPEFDYTAGGTFFVTICSEHRRCLFGEVVDGEMRLNDAGEMIDRTWRALGAVHPSISPKTCQVMPNHLHGVLVLTADERLSLGDVVGRFKTFTTTRYIDGVRHRGWSRFNGRLWQQGYFEHVVRDDGSLDGIREYIAANPANWHTDPYNPTLDRFSGTPRRPESP